MAIYFVDVKTFSRSRGESAVAAAAYRAGVRLVDQRTGVAHDYRRRHGVVAVEMFAPNNAPGWARDAGRLFVEAEKAETRVNARTARELQVALPFELDAHQRARLVAELAGLLVERYGVAVLAATHEPTGKGDERNFHCHLLFTTRAVTASGVGAKTRVLDDRTEGPKEVKYLRAAVAERTNATLIAAGVGARVDHRKLTVQAAEAEAAGDVARAVLLTRAAVRIEGKAGTAARRRRESTPRTRWNDAVRHDNRMVLANFFARTKAVRSTPVRAPRIDLAAPGWSEPGRGPGTRVINVQGERLRRGWQADEAAVRRWLDMLERERVRIAAGSRKTLAAYAVIARLKRADVRALAAHGVRDAECFEHLGRVLVAQQKHRKALQRSERARASHAAAMVHTAAAARQAEAVESGRPPPLWQPMTRRAWTEHRRRQRAALADAQARERGVAEASRGSDVEPALAEWQELERERRTRYPCPSDWPKAVQSAVLPCRKIGNKIGDESAREPTDPPCPVLTPRLRRRRRPGI